MEPSPAPELSAPELFVAAVNELVGHGAVQQRVNRAYTSSLANVRPTDVPVELQPRVEALVGQLGGTPITRAMMTDDTAAGLAREVVAIAFELARHAGTAEP
jgi:hypothetical protein